MMASSMDHEPHGPLYISSDVYRENSQSLMVPLDFCFSDELRFSLRIPSVATPTEAIECALKHAKHLSPSSNTLLRGIDFILKLSGFDILFLEDEPIMKNAYFDHLVRSFVLPRLSVIHKSEIKS